MARVGQTTATGGRSTTIYPNLAAIRPVTLAVNATLNYIGGFFFEQTTANANNIKGALYTAAGLLVHETAELTAPIASTSTPTEAHLLFSGQAVSAANYLLVVSSGPGDSGVMIVNGQNGPGGVPVLAFIDPAFYPDFPADISSYLDSVPTRSWDLFLDYSEAASGSATPRILSSLGAFL